MDKQQVNVGQLITIMQAARLKGMKAPLLAYYIKKGAFVPEYEIAGHKYYNLSDVRAWVKPPPEKRGRPIGVKNGQTKESQ